MKEKIMKEKKHTNERKKSDTLADGLRNDAGDTEREVRRRREEWMKRNLFNNVR